jgi:hypothetical protein
LITTALFRVPAAQFLGDFAPTDEGRQWHYLLDGSVGPNGGGSNHYRYHIFHKIREVEDLDGSNRITLLTHRVGRTKYRRARISVSGELPDSIWYESTDTSFQSVFLDDGVSVTPVPGPTAYPNPFYAKHLLDTTGFRRGGVGTMRDYAGEQRFVFSTPGTAGSWAQGIGFIRASEQGRHFSGPEAYSRSISYLDSEDEASVFPDLDADFAPLVPGKAWRYSIVATYAIDTVVIQEMRTVRFDLVASDSAGGHANFELRERTTGFRKRLAIGVLTGDSTVLDSVRLDSIVTMAISDSGGMVAGPADVPSIPVPYSSIFLPMLPAHRAYPTTLDPDWASTFADTMFEGRTAAILRIGGSKYISGVGLFSSSWEQDYGGVYSSHVQIQFEGFDDAGEGMRREAVKHATGRAWRPRLVGSQYLFGNYGIDGRMRSAERKIKSGSASSR